MRIVLPGSHALLCLFLMLTGLNSYCEENPLDRGRISPSIFHIAPNASQQFHVVRMPRYLRAAEALDDVRWSVNGVPGGNETLGTIDSAGLYHAPASVPSPPLVHVCAEADGLANPMLWASVIIGGDPPTLVRSGGWSHTIDEDAGATTTDKPPTLRKPQALAIDHEGNVLVVDGMLSRVFRYSIDGECLGEIGEGPGHAEAKFVLPRDVAVHHDGRIVTADGATGPPRLQVFAPDGSYRFGFGQKGTGRGRVMDTQGMVFDPAGRLLVCDIDNMRVNIYESDGRFVEAWETRGALPGQFNSPFGIVADPNGEVFVNNFYGPCQKFTREGAYLFGFAHAEPPNGLAGIQNAAGDRWGNVYLAVRYEGRSPGAFDSSEPMRVGVYMYNNNGDFITRVELAENEESTTAMAVDDAGRLYVGFRRGGRAGVETFELR